MADYNRHAKDESDWAPTPGRIMEAPEMNDAKPSPISVALNGLEHEVGVFLKLISVLEDRIQGILGPEVDGRAEGEKDTNEGKSPIVQSLNRLHHQVKYNRHRLDDIMDRIQL